MKISRYEAAGGVISTGSIVTVGNFDGVHRGHLAVIAEVKKRAATCRVEAVAVTFDPHPSSFLRPDASPRLITPLSEKLNLLERAGLDRTLVIPFAAVQDWPAADFARLVLADCLHVAEVHEGETFRFGRNAEAGLPELTELGAIHGFTVHACPPLVLRGAPVSSSRIRSLISGVPPSLKTDLRAAHQNPLAEARALLGRPFSVHSFPASGRGYGTRYTVPTINLAPYGELLPAHGVYITTLRIGTEGSARLFRGVTNIGNRPTFGADSFAVETHLLDFEPLSLSESTPLELTFLHRLRNEQRFPTPEALRDQIGRDVLHAQRYFSLCSYLTR